jgi:hypothetical protein
MPRFTYLAKSLPLQRELGRVALPSVRSNGPTDPLHISCICSIIVVNDLHKQSLNSYAAKNTICVVFFDIKDPKLSLSELLSMMTKQFFLVSS